MQKCYKKGIDIIGRYLYNKDKKRRYTEVERRYKMTNNMKPDTFELVTVFTDNEAISNDPREYIDRNSVEDEIALTKEWWSDKEIAYFEVDYYIDGERIKTEKIY